jgi:hypothetical protein
MDTARSVAAARACTLHVCAGTSRPFVSLVGLRLRSLVLPELYFMPPRRRPYACSGRVQDPGQTLESLEDFKRKLANEHTTVSAKLDQGARARQELQDLKSKLVDDLEQSRKALQSKVLLPC